MAQPEISYWIVDGQVPVRYCLPLKVTDKNYRWLEVEPCVPMLKAQRKILHEIFDHRCNTGEREGHVVWLIPEIELKKIASKIGDVLDDPEQLVSWGKARPNKVPLSYRGRSVDRDDFINFCHSMGFGENEEWLHFVWAQFTKLMAEWIIVRERPLDIGFAKLRSCPFREDWKPILTWCFPLHGRGHSRHIPKDFSKNMKAVWQSGILKCIFSLDLLAMRQKKDICLRHIDVELKPEWYKITMAVEDERLNRMGPNEYVNRYLQQIKNNVRTWVALYTKWLASIDRPSGICVQGDAPNQFRLVANIRAKSMYWKGFLVCGVHNLINRQWKPFKRTRAPETLFREDVFVPPMPPVESPAQDMWHTHRDMDSPYDKES